MTKYTDEQIIEAIKKAGGKKHPGIVYAWELSMYKQVIDALPEPVSDEWQQCRFEDIQKGDRVREVVKQDHGTIQTTEGVASYIDSRGTRDTWKTRDGIELALEDYIMDSHMVTLYRIPAPVQHPDPKKHPVILVTKVFDTEHDEPIPMIWDGGTYYESPKGCFHVESITDWSPAKVVAADE